MILQGIAWIVLSVAVLLLVAGAFAICWRYLNHKTAEPSELEANVKKVQDEIAAELKALKLRLLSLEGDR